MTKMARLTLVLTVVNLIVLAFGLAHFRPVDAQGVPAVVRAQGFELVDASGRVRAELKIFPADRTVKMPDGTTGSPETVLLRLISSRVARRMSNWPRPKTVPGSSWAANRGTCKCRHERRIPIGCTRIAPCSVTACLPQSALRRNMDDLRSARREPANRSAGT